MTASLNTVALMARHADLTAKLADACRELGAARATVIQRRAEIWDQTADLSVTERRETIAHATADLAAEVVTFEGEVDALRVELHHVELLIQMQGS